MEAVAAAAVVVVGRAARRGEDRWHLSSAACRSTKKKPETVEMGGRRFARAVVRTFEDEVRGSSAEPRLDSNCLPGLQRDRSSERRRGPLKVWVGCCRVEARPEGARRRSKFRNFLERKTKNPF